MRLLTLRTQQLLESARERATSGSNRSFSQAASVWKGERGAPSTQSGALAWAERRMQRGGIERIIRPDVASAERERPTFLGAPAKSWRRQGCPFTRSAPARSGLCSLARPCPAIQPSSPSPVFQKQPKLRRSPKVAERRRFVSPGSARLRRTNPPSSSTRADLPDLPPRHARKIGRA